MQSRGEDLTEFSVTPNGIHVPGTFTRHREETFEEEGFDTLLDMQSRHFWYRGRHRFLLATLRHCLRRDQNRMDSIKSGIDLGGGCGGWVRYLSEQAPGMFAELALGDSSERALELAGTVIDPRIKRYQVDLLNLPWKNRWDVIFMLDVLEHIPEHVEALTQAKQSLCPGGLLIVATPALKFFWSYNDDLSHHVRRYSKRDFASLANDVGLTLILSRYYMFFLSPLLYLSRLRSPKYEQMTAEQIRDHLTRTHLIPSTPVNETLATVFQLESPLGVWLPFPWGTSIVSVFQKPL